MFLRRGYGWFVGQRLDYTKDNPNALQWFLDRFWYVQDGQNNTESLVDYHARYSLTEGVKNAGKTGSGKLYINSWTHTNQSASQVFDCAVSETALTLNQIPAHDHTMHVGPLHRYSHDGPSELSPVVSGSSTTGMTGGGAGHSHVASVDVDLISHGHLVSATIPFSNDDIAIPKSYSVIPLIFFGK